MSSENPANPQLVHDFIVKDTHGNDVPLDKYKGNVLLIVNIASKCGLTSSNYKELTELHDQYKDKGLFNKLRNIFYFFIEFLILYDEFILLLLFFSNYSF